MDCLFCKIINGDIPSVKVYEDEYVYAFNDIEPQAPVHVVLVPKTHISSTEEINSDNSIYVAKIFEAIAKISRELDLSSGFRVINNCGKDGGQTVGHLHYHLLAGRGLHWPPG